MCVYHVYKDTEGRERVKNLKRYAFRGMYVTDVTRALRGERKSTIFGKIYSMVRIHNIIHLHASGCITCNSQYPIVQILLVYPQPPPKIYWTLDGRQRQWSV